MMVISHEQGQKLRLYGAAAISLERSDKECLPRKIVLSGHPVPCASLRYRDGRYSIMYDAPTVGAPTVGARQLF